MKIANEYGHVRHIPPPVKRSKAKKPKKEKIAKSAVEEVLAEGWCCSLSPSSSHRYLLEEQIEEEDVPSVSEIMDQVLSERLWEHDLPISSQVHSNVRITMNYQGLKWGFFQVVLKSYKRMT